MSVDYEKALEMEGVVGCIDAHDVEKGKKIGKHDTPVFVEDEVVIIFREKKIFDYIVWNKNLGTPFHFVKTSCHVLSVSSKKTFR